MARAITGSEPAFERWVRTAPPLAPGARIEVYENAWFARLEGSLRDDYPALAACLGDEDFTALVAHYLQAYPPASPRLLDEGARLPEYLSHYLDGERPWLLELARLERACLEAEHSPDEPSEGLRALEALPPGQWATFRLRLGASVRLLRCQWEVEPLWRAPGEAHRAPAGPAQAGNTLLIHRDAYTVKVENIGARPAELSLLALLGESPSGCGLGDLLERSEHAGLPELLASWAARGIVAG